MLTYCFIDHLKALEGKPHEEGYVTRWNPEYLFSATVKTFDI